MPNLFKITAGGAPEQQKFTKGELLSVLYHDFFDYPLTLNEMIRWRASEDLTLSENFTILGKNGFYFKEGKEGIIYKRTLRKRISERKLKLAEDAAGILSLLPWVKMVGITGSLAMENASDESDIDLIIITRGGALWKTRILSHLLLLISGKKIRKAGEKDQKDKLCLNIWMDEDDLSWTRGRNIYTAHEISQIKPLINKAKTYERFISKNIWIKRYWPNATNKLSKSAALKEKSPADLIEKIAYRFQYRHMKSKITRETVTPTRALFHPQDWGKVLLDRLNSLT